MKKQCRIYKYSRNLITLIKIFPAMLAALLLFSSAYSSEIKNVEWNTFDDYIRFVITIDGDFGYTDINDITDKNYFYLNISNITKEYSKSEIQTTDKRLQAVRLSYFDDHNILRVVFYTKTYLKYNITQLKNPNRIVIDITDKGFEASSDIYKKKIVVIDPGHGGKSLGGRSHIKIGGNYIFEKDIVLNISKKLKKLIDKNPNMTAQMIRESDDYISLKDRVEKSEQLKGDLFISIHSNDSPYHKKTDAQGIEFYYWSETGSNDAAVAYLEELNNDAELELDISKEDNKKVYDLFKNMLKDKLEAETVESQKFCDLMNDSFKEYPYFVKHNRGVKNARFKVLQNYNMPAVLVETGFINNTEELNKLTDPNFQDVIAKCIYNSINTYLAKEDPKFKADKISIK